MKFSIVLLFILSAFGIQAQKTLTIKGSVTNDLEGLTTIYLRGEGTGIDSTEIKNGAFKFTLPFEKPCAFILFTKYEINKIGGGYTTIVTDQEGTITLGPMDLNKGINVGTVSGNTSAVDYHEFMELYVNMLYTVGDEMQKEGLSPQPIRPGEQSTEGEAYLKRSKELETLNIVPIMERFVKSHPDSYAAVYAIRYNGLVYLGIEDLERIYNLLSEKNKKYEESQYIADHLKGLKYSRKETIVKDFTLNTPKGKLIALSSLKGKYVLIDFWASWCMPCIASFPHLKEIYEQYKGNNFEIYSISIDKVPADWLKAVAKYQLPWKHSLDTKKISQSGFAVGAIPAMFLIDPTGKIVMGGDDFHVDGALEKKLSEIFKSNAIQR